MTIAIEAKVKSDLSPKMLKALERTPEAMNVVAGKYANVLKESVKRKYLRNAKVRGASPRTKSASQFKVISNKDKMIHRVDIPRRSFFLDSMRPHYVALKRGRLVTKWTRRYFGSKRISGKSKIHRGPRGGIKGALYVTPDPFIEEGVRLARTRINLIAKRELERNFRG